MSPRRFATYLAGVVIAATAAIFGASAPAPAATVTDFSVFFEHSSGTRTSTISGDVNWFNWSVTLTGINQTVRSGECSYLWADAYIGGRIAFSKSTSPRCSGTFSPSNLVLDPEPYGYRQKVEQVEVYVVDSTHGEPEGWGPAQWLTR